MLSLSEVQTVMMRPMGFKEDDRKVTRSFSFGKGEPESLPTPRRANNVALDRSPSFKTWGPEKKIEANLSFKSKSSDASLSGCDGTNKVENEAPPVAAAEKPLYQLISPRPKEALLIAAADNPLYQLISPRPKEALPVAAAENPLYQLISPRPKEELDECATKLQKVFRSYRTRRNLADAAVIIEEYWWQALDFASLEINSVMFYHDGKSEKAVSRWSRAKRRLAKVGKGLSLDEKAQKLAIQHWLEAIDPRHRYGHNLHLYYEIWYSCESTQPFFYWLDAGDGKVCDLKKCPRSRLQSQIIKYLGPNERESYEVIVLNGRLIYKKDNLPVHTSEGSKWIFVLSTSKNLYVGKKKKGNFQHSSFLAGAATTAAGRLVAKDGLLQAIWPYSGHYLPTKENFTEFLSFLEDNNVDLSSVKQCSVDDDNIPSKDVAEPSRATTKWSSGVGPRIGCVRDYPVDLQAKALEHVNLSPRIPPSPARSKVPIPSPRPSPNVRISPQLTRMGFSPRGCTAELQVLALDNGRQKLVISPVGNRNVTASPHRSPMGKLSLSMLPPAGFPTPDVKLTLPLMKGRRSH